MDEEIPGNVPGLKKSVFPLWWTRENAHKMLALRTLRSNNQWEVYWDELHDV